LRRQRIGRSLARVRRPRTIAPERSAHRRLSSTPSPSRGSNEGNTGNSRDFWSKSDRQPFGTPLISSTCRSNSLSLLTGNFVERIRYQKKITVNQNPRNSESWNGGGWQLAGDSYRFPSGCIQTPFRAREASLLAGFYCPHLTSSRPIPHHPARSNHLSCVDRQFNLHSCGSRPRIAERKGKRDEEPPVLAAGFEPTRDFHPCRFSSSTEPYPPASIPSNPVQ